MIIENPDALRAWLTAWLGPKCDADPAALSKYVMALVKKDKSEKELKDICIDQLDVFLQRGTKQFVDLLFETLNSKSYLDANVVSEPLNGSSVDNTPPVNTPVETTNLNGAAPPVVSIVNSVPLKAPEVSLVSSKVTPVVASSFPTSAVTSTTAPVTKPESKRPKSGNESDEREAKRSRIGRSKSRSKSPPARSSRSKIDRDNDDRRSRRFPDDDRRRKNFQSRPRYDNRYRDFRRGGNIQDNDRDRDNRQSGRSKDRKGGRSSDRNQADRSKSRSRSGSPWNRNRSRSWSRSSSRSRSPSRSPRSRSWSRSRDRNRDANRNDNREGRNPPSSSSNDHGDKDYRNPPITGANATAIGSGGTQTANVSSTNNSAPPANPPNSGEGSNFRPKHPRRCRDYDEKGYCMRGDLCPYDHGMDPVVLEDVSVLPGFPQNDNGNTAVNQPASQMLPPPPGVPMPSLIINQSNSGPPGDSFLPEPYNPLEPGMERPTRMRSPFWGHPPPSHGPPGSGPPLRPPLGRGPPHMFHSGPPHRTRELIGVPTIDNPELSSGPKSVILRTVLEPLQPQTDSNERPNPVINSVAVTRPQGYMHRGGMHDNGGFRRRIFDYNRLGPRKMPMNSNVDRCTLELRKVPRHQNTITELNSHFSKFGTIVNLQVCYGGDPEAALIQFSSHTEANAAYRCTDAVLNNRFIKVFWHNKENASGVLNPPGSETTTQSNEVKPPADSSSVDISSSTEVKEGIPAPKSNVKDRLGIAASMVKINNIVKKVVPNSTTEETTEKAVLFTPSGNLSRTVYNPLALKKNNLITANMVPRKSKEEQRKECLKHKCDVQNKHQQLMQMHMKEQKILVSKWEKSKDEKEKAELKERLKLLNKTIDTLSAEMRKNATEIMTLNKSVTKVAAPKTKTDSLNLTKAEKELLDAEMDLYNKQHRGDDTTELMKKVTDLRQQAKSLGLLDSSGRLKAGASVQYGRGGATAGARYRGRGGMVMSRKLTSVDRRPKRLLVEGAADLDRDTLLMHFSQCSLVERLEMLGSGIAIVTFKTRRDAEKAISLGAKLNEQSLKLTWYNESSASTGAEDSNLEGRLDMSDLRVNDENLEQSDDEEEDTLLGDDEEEEDSEARSWRR